jgi:hypothetical protein
MKNETIYSEPRRGSMSREVLKKNCLNKRGESLKMLSSEQKVQECDATEVDSSTAAGFTKIKNDK